MHEGARYGLKFFLYYAEMQHFLDCLTHAPCRSQADKSPGHVAVELNMVLVQLLPLQIRLNLKSAPCILVDPHASLGPDRLTLILI